MAKSRYVDITSIMQVIGCVYKKPQLLDLTDKYNITEFDFVEEFHKILFGTIYKLHESGMENISLINIEDFLSTRPKHFAIFKNCNGEEYVKKIEQTINNVDGFDYYYNRLKKMTLLRAYDSMGVDISFIYDIDEMLDMRKKQRQEEFLNNCSIADIVKKVDDKIDEVKIKYGDSSCENTYQAGDGIFDLIEKLKNEPAYGSPMYGALINTITRGCRLKKFYLRSGGTGLGKSRTMVADACYLGCDEIYNDTFGWVKNGIKEKVLYISTEQELEEIQTMMLAFLSNVNETKILTNSYDSEEEKERVIKAAHLLVNSPVYIETIPDFSMQDIENLIKRNIRDNDVKYVFYDYLHSSLKILEEITQKTGGIKLREDTVLFMISNKLKDICNEQGVFILSGTQLSGDYHSSEMPDQTLLRGSKAIADKIDYGCHILPITQKDLQALENVVNSGMFKTPNLKLSIYKNRQNAFKGVYLWCDADLGTCRVNPMFLTDWNYQLKPIENIDIKVEEKSAF